ncbi:hypothetical protein F5Y17DRAFT_471065 [Xylariaceae sp. FL0594]|nr:hypothetical protein F5Y17DRAFT_471065 [Xylariaceae sp. FL0594]
MSAPNQASGKAIAIGIDFGTTYTGVAYGYGANEPMPVGTWPLGPQIRPEHDSPKVPSKIAYFKRSNALTAPSVWGYQAWDEPGAISWFKLFLLEQRDLQSHLTNSDHLNVARERVRELGKDVIDIIADYLAQVWKHAVERIQTARSKGFILNNRLHIVVTVPAICALHQAGIFDKRPQCDETTWAFVSEPEATALASIEGHQKHNTLKPGQTFVIADLGGGTVDLISFQVRATEPQLLIDEVVEGNGGLCGATFLDQAFEKYLEIMTFAWERGIKRNYYAGAPGQRIDLGSQGNRRPVVSLEPDELNEVFDSVYLDIAKLIEGQVLAILRKTNEMPKYIFQKVQEQWANTVEILCEEGDKPWTAVSRGAVLAGLEHVKNQSTVRSHVSRYSYGWTKKEPFNNRTHEIEDFDEDEITGRQIAKDQMEWIIYRGESIQTQKPHVYEYERYFDINDVGIFEFSEPIYRSRLSSPPSRLADNWTEAGPASDPAGFELYVTIDMKTPVRVEQLLKRGSRGNESHVLEYNVQVNVSGASLIIEATSEGKRIGKKTIVGIDK